MLTFDSWQRCETVRHLIQWSMEGAGRLLDVGGYPGRMRALMPEHEWIICDPLVDSAGDQVQGSGTALPFLDESFDFSIALDVLEHVPPDGRLPMIEEMLRVSREGIILTFPYHDRLVEAAELHVCELYRRIHRKEHPWLSEHAQFALPNVDEIVEYLDSLGGSRAVFDVGTISRWVYLQTLDLLLNTLPRGIDLAEQIDAWYQEALYIHEFKSPAYRKVVMYLANRNEPIDISMVESTREEESLADIDFYSHVHFALIDELLRSVHGNAGLHAAEHRMDTVLETQTPADTSQQSDRSDTKQPVPANQADMRSVEEYITRLEKGMQAWEETYQSVLNEITQAVQWRDQLEQRKSFRVYKGVMRVLGKRVDP